MLKLLQQYSVTQILVFICILAAAIKGVISFADWGYDRIRQVFDKEYKQQTEKEKIYRKLEADYAAIEELKNRQAKISDSLDKLGNKLDLLMDSDRDSIKSFLTRQHHYFCYQKGWIDDYSLECCEKRYGHYKDEGGNSFIEGFMEELRGLPKQQHTKNKK